MTTLQCLQCNKPFEVRHYRAKTAKFCSFSCRSRHPSMARPRTGIMAQCMVCGISFYVRRYRKDSVKYCSRSCLAKAHLPKFVAVFGFQKSSKPPHKYKQMKVDGKMTRVHRHVMEQHLGRKLSRDEHVHHINGDSQDNRLENLVVLSNADHQRLELSKRR